MSFFDKVLSELDNAYKGYKCEESEIYQSGIAEGRRMDFFSVWAALTIDELATIIKSKTVKLNVSELPSSLVNFLQHHKQIKDSVYQLINKPNKVRRRTVEEWISLISQLPSWDRKTKRNVAGGIRDAGLSSHPDLAALISRPAEKIFDPVPKIRQRFSSQLSVENSLRWIRGKFESGEISCASDLISHQEGSFHYRFLQRKAGIKTPFEAAIGRIPRDQYISSLCNREIFALLKARQRRSSVRRQFLRRLMDFTQDRQISLKLLLVIQLVASDHFPEVSISKLDDKSIKSILVFLNIKSESECEIIVPSLYRMLRRMKYVEEKFYQVWFPDEFEERRKI